MIPKRLTTSLNLDSGERLIVLYGTNTKDSFCSSDLVLRDIEQVLHGCLRAQGYERIIFYSGVEKLYFLDQRSRDRCLPKSSSRQKEENNKKPLRTSGGPLGNKKGLLGKKKSQPSTTESQAPVQRMQDVQIISLLETVMQDTEQLSAIVFSNAEDLANFDNPRELWGRIINWSRLPPDNKNCCVFIFHHETSTELQQFCQNNQFTLLANLLQRRDAAETERWNIQRLATPTAEEITHLQHYFRISIKYNKTVDWKNLENLSVWLAAENQHLKNWYSKFEQASEISLAEAREKNWLSGTVSTEPALQRLEAMIGLQEVKKVIHRKKSTLEVERDRRNQGVSRQPSRLHLVFKGNPGTGKTTVARLIGEIYRDLGLLQRGHLIEIGGRELVAGYVGQTATQTNEIVDRALDGVLFIDEAYTLNQDGGNDFGQEAIDTLLQRMENERERLAVIIAGYPNLMDNFMTSNPGLQERFTTTVNFEDYVPDELLSIFQNLVSQIQGRVSPDLENTLPSIFENCYNNRDENFGNARFVENLFNKIDENRSLRVSEQGLDPLQEPFEVSDIPEEYQVKTQDQKEELDTLLQELDQLVGLETVKETVRELVNEQIYDQRLQEEEGTASQAVTTRHFIFTGNPGTGKTTVARLIGRIFHALGLLRKGHFQEATRSDLVAGYVGQTAEKTKNIIHSALDGVLFIDEAYALSQGGDNDFGQEAINELVPAMENYRDRLIVILAGYSREMATLLDSNSGLRSRVSYTIHFPDYQPQDLHNIFIKLCQQNQRHCSPELKAYLPEAFQRLYDRRDENFGNGRDVRNLYETMLRRQKSRAVRENLRGEAMRTFTLEDIPSDF